MTKPHATAPVPEDGRVATAFPSYSETPKYLRWVLAEGMAPGGKWAVSVHGSMVHVDGGVEVVVDVNRAPWKAYRVDQVVVVDEFNAPLPKE